MPKQVYIHQVNYKSNFEMWKTTRYGTDNQYCCVNGMTGEY